MTDLSVSIKIYTNPLKYEKESDEPSNKNHHTTNTHSFHVNNEITGLSSASTTIFPISASTTFYDLREIIEYKKDHQTGCTMLRRTILHSEIMYVAMNCSNPFEYDTNERMKYCFGMFPRRRFNENEIGGDASSIDSGAIAPIVINPDIEDQPIVEIVGCDKPKLDLLVIVSLDYNLSLYCLSDLLSSSCYF